MMASMWNSVPAPTAWEILTTIVALSSIFSPSNDL